MKKMNKKGFTIVELVIVVAVIAILSAVLIPTFSSVVHNANVSNDKTLVRNLNTALAANAKEEKTMQDALDAAAEFGYDVAKINNTKVEENDIVWDSNKNEFVYNENGTLKDAKYWVIDDEPNADCSTYLWNYKGNGSVTTTKSIDVSNATNAPITSLTYATEATQDVVLYTASRDTNVTINAKNSNVAHYGAAGEVVITAVKGNSYHEFGKAYTIEIASGRVVVEAGAQVNTVIKTADTATVEAPASVAQVSESDPAKIEEIKAGAQLFACGDGSEASPYVIENVEQLANINKFYGEGYKYFEVSEDVEKLDCAELPTIELQGSFNGNGVKLINLTHALFYNVGYDNEETTIKNIDATMNVTNGQALVRNLNSVAATFENVSVHGYIEGNYNMGSIYNYGNCISYTVNFVNVKSDATLVCTTGNSIGGLVGHSYEGAGNVFTLNMDENTAYTGEMYVTGNAKGGAIICMSSNNTYTLNGVANSPANSDKGYKVTVLAKVNPTLSDNGYVVATQANVASIKVSVNVQLTAYDEEDQKIQNLSGITWVIAEEMIADPSDSVQVFAGEVTSMQIVNGQAAASYNYANGALTINTQSSANYKTGTVTIFVTQYDARGNIVAVGSVMLYDLK